MQAFDTFYKNLRKFIENTIIFEHFKNNISDFQIAFGTQQGSKLSSFPGSPIASSKAT